MNYLIVGQGIAGSLLGFELFQRGHQITFYNQPSLLSSTKVSAGLFNPVVFKRLLPSWKADDLIPFLKHKYQELERLLNCNFLHFVNIAKLIENEDEKNLWQKREADNDINHYLSVSHLHSNNALGGFGEVKESGYLDTELFLDQAKSFFKANCQYLEEEFVYSKINFSNQTVEYKKNSYDAIVFCEGFHIKNNPFFSSLPFKHVKGEILTVEIDEYKNTRNINKSFFLLPLANGQYKLGSTYDWNTLDFLPTSSAKNDLLLKLSSYISSPVKVIEHKAGVRPSSNDRRPILGAHQTHQQLFVFNGLGAKGIMLAPYFAKEMALLLTEGVSPNKEVTIERFYV